MHWSRLPEEHRPKGVWEVKKWLFHPIKRRAARFYLVLLQKVCGLKAVAITGSAGKTTTKEMVRAILMEQGRTVASYKNIDPVYNIPTTILRCWPWTDFLVLEMGVEYPGEMEFYGWLVRAQVGVITNIYPTHTQFFGSVEGVFDEKKGLVDNVMDGGVVVLNGDDQRLRKLAGSVKEKKVVLFGRKEEVRAEKIKINPDLSTSFTLFVGGRRRRVRISLPGEQFVYNALAAVAVGCEMGCSLGEIVRGLRRFEIPEHRMRLNELANGVQIIDDTYNNNPVAAREALRVLAAVSSGKKVGVVFGDMLELGKLGRGEHRKVGKQLAEMRVRFVVGVGRASKEVVETYLQSYKQGEGVWCDDWKQAVGEVRQLLEGNLTVLVKGSRSIGLEKLVSELCGIGL